MAAHASTAGAVLFDLDGTLVDREPIAALALVELCSEHGWRLEEPWPGALLGRAWQDVFRELGVADRLGWDEATFTRRVTDRCLALEADVGVTAMEGAVELVQALAARSVRLGLVTGSTSREASAVLAQLGVADAFEIVVTAEEYTAGKPAPDPYRTALTRLALPAWRAIAVEDSAVGVEAARRAGLRVIAMSAQNGTGAPPTQQLGLADLVVPTLADPGLLGWLLDALRGGRPEE